MATKKKSASKAAKKGPKPSAKTKTGGPARPPAKTNAKTKAKAKVKATPARKPAKGRPARAKTAKVARKAPAKERVNAVIHWEIQAKEPQRLQQFYAEVFGWAIDVNNPMNYGMVTSKAAEGINGGIGGSMESTPGVVVYTEVPSIPSTLSRVEERGGQTLMPRTDIGPVVMALYLDPEGNRMGLIETR